MKKSLNKSKKRLVFVMAVMFILCTGLCFRAGWIQIVRGEEYSRMAVQQQIRDVTIPAKRGMIYDANKKELAVSTVCYSVWARPANVQQGETAEEKTKKLDRTVKTLAHILKRDEAEIKDILTQKRALVKVDKYLDKDTADKIREKKLTGIEIAQDVKRYYPLQAFLAHTLGSVTDDNTGLSGLELQYEQTLSGISGRWIKNTDIVGNGLSYGDETYYQEENGLSLVLTIDENIQHYVEKSIAQVQKNTSSDRVMAIMMSPKIFSSKLQAHPTICEFSPNAGLSTLTS